MPAKKQREDEARRRTLDLYPAWALANGYDPEPRDNGKRINGTTAMLFYQFLEAEHPSAVDFSYPGDKWQAVHGWLRGAGISV